jgi:methionyl aminopeptidase
VPGYLKGAIEDTMELQEGMTLALEIIYAQGGGAVEYANNDGWTIATKDGSLASVFEHTVAITGSEPIVLTRFTK